MRKVIFIASTLSTLFAAAEMANACAPGPRCQAEGARYKSYTQRMTARLSNSAGTANAAMLNYCVMKAGAELSRLCADEQMAQGRRDCAKLAYEQIEPPRVCRRLQLLREWSHDKRIKAEEVLARGA